MSRAFRAVIRRARLIGLRAPLPPSRRDFLRRTAQGAAALAMAPTLASLVGCRDNGAGGGPAAVGAIAAPAGRLSGRHVCIVGAGFAGLACADVLMRAGAEVTVLEAAERAGGRVHSNSQFIPGAAIEMGGEYIGENHPTWQAYARRFRLPIEPVPTYEGEDPIILDGLVITGRDAEQLIAEVDGVLAKIEELAAGIDDPVRPWLSSNAAELDETTMAQFIAEQNLSDLARTFFGTGASADNGVPAERMSLLAYLSMVRGGGLADYYEISETHRVRGGNAQLAQALVKTLGHRVAFRSPVTRIARDAKGAMVATEAGREVRCDAVVLAIPPTQWSKIDMGLPIEQVPQMGRNVKCILRLSRPVWEGTGFTPEASTNGITQYTWVPGQAAKTEGTVGLTLFSGSDWAERWRTMPHERRPREGIAALSPALPQLSDATRASMFIDWVAMERFQGSYSFPAPGQVTAMGPTLVDGLVDEHAPFMFAGEHTSYAFIGYMEGALSSGVRVARQLAERLARV